MPKSEQRPQGRRLVPEKLEDSGSAGSGSSVGDGTRAGRGAGTGSSSHSRGGKDGKGGQAGKAPSASGAKGHTRAVPGGFRGGADIARPEQASEEERLLLLEEEKVADEAAELERRKVAYAGGFDPFAQIKLGEAGLACVVGRPLRSACANTHLLPASLHQLCCTALTALQPRLSCQPPTAAPSLADLKDTTLKQLKRLAVETVPTAAEMETAPLLSHPAGLSALLSGASKRVQLCKPTVGAGKHRGECQSRHCLQLFRKPCPSAGSHYPCSPAISLPLAGLGQAKPAGASAPGTEERRCMRLADRAADRSAG